MKRSFHAALFLSALWACPAAAEPQKWGPADLRRVMSDWLHSKGRAAPADSAIGPLDPRLSVDACDQVEIAPRGASSSTFILKCSAPSVWNIVLRIDHLGPPSSMRAVAVSETGVEGASWRIVVPKVNLPSGAVLTAEVLEERIVASAPSGQALKSIADAVGLRATSAIGPGLTLTTRNVTRAPLVAKGENVTLVANGSGFEISVPGRAEQDGYEGDLIMVKNSRTGIVLKGRLERGKIVSVMQL
jgi:flagella basal body P-ring formation protein FlgA